MDSSELTRRRVNQLFYTNYLFQQTRVNGGCSNRVQLQTLAGGGAMDASLIPVLKNGEIGTTVPQYQQIVESAACPSQPSTGSTGSTGTSEYSYVFGTFTNDTLAVYDANNQQTLTLNKDLGLYNTTYLVKCDSSGTPIWGAKMGFTFNTYGQSARFNGDMSSVYAKGSYVYVACVVAYSYNIGQTIDLYNAGGTTPSLTLTFNLTNVNTAYEVLILAKYDLNGVVQWANYINTMSSSGSTDPTVLNQINIKRSNIHVDQNDNVYVGFHFNETIAINKNSAVIDDRESIGVFYGSSTYDSILIKYSSSGIYQWYLDAGVNSVGSITNSIVAVSDIMSDSSGNIYVAYISSLAEPVDFFPSSDSSQSVFTLPPDSVNRWFNPILKINTLGVIQWGTIIRTGGASGKALIALDSSQNLYVAAMYGWGGYLEVFNQNSFTSPAITSPFSSQGNMDLALIKYTSTGMAQWASYLAGPINEQQPIISINSQNKITILGATNSNSIAIYDTSSNVTPASTLSMTSGGYKIFFAEFDTSGILQKKAYFGPVTPTQNPRPDFQHGINNSLYITVGMEPNVTAILYDSTNTNILTFTNNILINSFASRIVIVVKYDGSFTPQWLTYLADNSLPQIATSSS